MLDFRRDPGLPLGLSERDICADEPEPACVFCDSFADPEAEADLPVCQFCFLKLCVNCGERLAKSEPAPGEDPVCPRCLKIQEAACA